MNDSLLCRQKGLTLVEILVAIVVSSLLLIGITEIFISSKATYNVQEGLSRLQENARLAMDLLARDIRMANFLGCAQRNYNSENILVSSAYRSVLRSNNNFMWDYQPGIQGFQATANSWLPDLSSRIPVNSPDNESDIISIRIPIGSGVRLTSDMTDGDDGDSDADNEDITVRINDTTSLGAGDIALISDCTTTTIFQITGYSQDNATMEGVIEHVGGLGTPGNSNDRLGYAFLANATVFPVETVTYYVRESMLWRRVDGTNPTVDRLIEGVENIQITYGLDTIGNDERADFYLTADGVENFETPPDPVRSWRRVVSVRIGLLMRTPEEVIPRSEGNDVGNYNVNGTVIDPPDDRHLRRIFGTTIALRNRAP